MPLTVACVLRKSAEYDTDYVDKLSDGVKRHLGLTPLCIEDSRWPGWWCKMAMFASEHTGDILYFDLDTVIVGDLTEIGPHAVLYGGSTIGCGCLVGDGASIREGVLIGDNCIIDQFDCGFDICGIACDYCEVSCLSLLLGES